MSKTIVCLGIETSCDETSVAVVADTKKILGHVVSSQIRTHQQYGGVVPEIAARAHLQLLPFVIEQALKESGLGLNEVDVIAATSGPGLIGGLAVGVMAAKAMAAALNKPFVAVNHLEGHALTVRLIEDVDFPFLLLLVSGGHCQLMLVKGVGSYQVLGGTLDDAVGECFDKVARLLGLPYPGGPQIELMAKQGDVNAYAFPRPLWGQKHLNLSFSGLKTAVRQVIEAEKKKHGDVLPEAVIANVCASFQNTVSTVLYERLEKAIMYLAEEGVSAQRFVVAGGVAANEVIRKTLLALCDKYNLKFFAPPLKLCTDNGAMIAWVGLERFNLGLFDNLDFKPRPRWPLSDLRSAE